MDNRRNTTVLIGLPELSGNKQSSLAELQASPAVQLPVLHLLVVDDDDSVREACSAIARRMGFAVVVASDLAGARVILHHQKLDLVLLDLKSHGAGGKGGLGLLEEIKTLHPDTGVIVMTAFATVSSAAKNSSPGRFTSTGRTPASRLCR